MADSFSIEMKLAQTPRGIVSYSQTGSGPALLLLHGIGSSAQSWRAAMSILATRFQVIAWNAPGYGQSTHLAQPQPETEDYAQCLHALVETLDIKAIHLVGHSLGALMATRFARLFPAKVRTLQLASCALGHARYDAPRRAALLQSRLDDVDNLGIAGMAAKRGPNLLSSHASADMIAQVVETMASLDARGYAQAAHMLSSGDLLSDIAALDATLPLQVLYGADDRITPPAANEEAAAARQGTKITRIPDAGHAVYIEKPEEFSAAVAAFAQQVAP